MLLVSVGLDKAIVCYDIVDNKSANAYLILSQCSLSADSSLSCSALTLLVSIRESIQLVLISLW